MPVDIMLTVVAFAVVQSIFGVGALWFGMPLGQGAQYSITTQESHR